MTGPKKTGEELDFKTDDRPRILPKINIRGGFASVMGNRYVKRSDTRKIQYWEFETL